MIFLALYFFSLLNTVTNSVTNRHLLPKSDITLDCGSSRNSTRPGDRRTWSGDVSSKLFPLDAQNKVSACAEVVDSVDEVPYRTARFSVFEFTYTLPVTPGVKIVRLHFSSAKYKGFDTSKAFFSVKAGPYTFLKNFSVSLNTEGLQRGNKLVKEFCLPVETSNLIIKFTPTTSMVSDAIAFVNGIEIVSMPADLYYSVPDAGLRFVGQAGRYFFTNNTAMENVYRVNVGGKFISRDDDDFFRTWEGADSEERFYLTRYSKILSVIPVTGSQLTWEFPQYIAPAMVYRTALSPGFVRESIRSYNLTWEFPVDLGFYYMVRLHFCEISKVIKFTGDRVFRIFMLNQTAERRADVIRWSGGQYVPYFRDYIVSVISKGVAEKKQKLSIALEAMREQTKYTDAILNGVEIFKLNDATGNLAGPNLDPIPHPVPSQQNEKTNRTSMVGIISGAVVTLALIIGLLVLWIGRKVKESGHSSLTTTKSSKACGSSSKLPSHRCRYISLAEIIAATNNFEDISIIGVGGFGNVYKGYLDNGTTPVAIKRLKPKSSQGVREFRSEIELLSHLRHRHLVSLIGYCNDNREMILVYEYMAHGTLRDHLYNTEKPPLTWKQRLEICIGAANGLHYLHKGINYTIIHRDVKTTNILLDEKFVARISDFGLSRACPTTISKTHITTIVKGSFGYLDPEYYKRQQLTEKSDVYSFGVVLCEILCGRPPIVKTAETTAQVGLAGWVQSCHRNGTLDEIIDPNLKGKIAPDCFMKYGELAVQCMVENGTERPSMKDIVRRLEFVMQLQKNAESDGSVSWEIVKRKAEEEVTLYRNYNSDSDGAFACSWKGISGTVFSEITDHRNGR
ncbi:receptor-like protein kinase FERONIA [Humulus lupulus]|uniref:receptor-like protein kinase FERONIA n=1 Tax=Humulus lupulus TaxID=3486 RepID=UPI002B403E72|nr:receptor-like protein kinase FERONIA [Humulus lupulus]